MSQLTHRYGAHAERPSFSLPAILAVACAIASFFFGAGWGFLLATAAIVLGLVGVSMAFLPNVRGGIVSIVSIVAGVIGVIAAIFKLVL